MKKLTPFALLVIAALFMFYQDGAFDGLLGKNVSEEQIISDISENNSDIMRYGLSVADIDILSSEQDEDLGIYACSVKYSAENTDVSYTGNMSLTYMKHDGVWLLSKCEGGDTFYEPKNACDESIPKAYIQSQYAELGAADAQLDFETPIDSNPYIVPNAVDMTSSVHPYYYIVSGRESSIRSWSDSWYVSCHFDIDNGWYVEDALRERLSETWDICGKYTFQNDDFSTSIDVISFDVDIESSSATLVWSWQFIRNGVTYTSDGQETKVFDLTAKDSYVKSYGNLASVYFCGRSGISWDTENYNTEGVDILISNNYNATYWLTKQ